MNYYNTYNEGITEGRNSSPGQYRSWVGDTALIYLPVKDKKHISIIVITAVAVDVLEKEIDCFISSRER